jgi:hypothetical protein
MLGKVVEGTIVLVMAYLVFVNASGFATAAKAAGSVYVNAVQALQGRSDYKAPSLG